MPISIKPTTFHVRKNGTWDGQPTLVQMLEARLPEDLKQALLQLAQKVAYIDDQGQTYYQDLYDALYPPKTVVSITATYTQSGTVYDTDSLDSLKADLVVTATYDDQSTAIIPATAYTLSGTLTEGTSTITVSYGGKTAAFDVTVTHRLVPAAYQPVEWIGNTAQSWIKPADHKLPTAFRIEAKSKLTGYNSTATYGNIAACMQPNSSKYGMELAYKREDDTLIMFQGAQSVVTPSDISAELVVGGVCDGEKTKAYLLINGERVYGNETTVNRDYTGDDWGIFWAGSASSSYNQFVGQLYWLRLYDANDQLIEQWLPCYRKSDGEIGLYETVSGAFHANDGRTALTKGGDI